ncbi:TM2 domain-containing protein [Schistosoma japonicum]|uniref:TM2 domain-containing protein n=1 Tax=Schistosoma japonicum TaxID=6182 RepID=A0A4Z2D7I1_SCHJA|nr:TM2 domain-containing protein [Schistosoma japonicum]
MLNAGMLCYVFPLIAFHFCLKLTHSVQYSGDQSCENLLPGQYFCDSPLIDELTQQPKNCSPSLKAPVNCRPAPGIRCGGRLYSGTEIGFQKLIDCRRVTGYKFDLALLLSVFGGLLGLDRFYLGYPALGCLKFFTFGGFGLWYLADILLISIEVLSLIQRSLIIDVYNENVVCYLRYLCNKMKLLELFVVRDDINMLISVKKYINIIPVLDFCHRLEIYILSWLF